MTRGVVLVDVTYPDAPDSMTTVPTPGSVGDVITHGDLVYVADEYGLIVYRSILPPGACCLGDGSCVVADVTECETSLAGEYMGLHAECYGDLDLNGIDDGCQPTGACCLGGGDCLETNRPHCEITLGGVYLGDGAECLGDQYDPLGEDDACQDLPPAGACCLPDYSCSIEFQEYCENTLGGEYLGDDTECVGDHDANGLDDGCEPEPLCCEGRVGDANGDGQDNPTIGDVSVMLDALFVGGDWSVIPCPAEADINKSGGADPQGGPYGDVTIGDVMYLIDYLFITGSELGLPDCY
jgi:hypothetical protein